MGKILFYHTVFILMANMFTIPVWGAENPTGDFDKIVVTEEDIKKMNVNSMVELQRHIILISKRDMRIPTAVWTTL